MAGERILIIENEKPVRWSLSKEFSKEGYSVSEANNGAAGLEMLKQASYDLVLLDYTLPDTDGVSVLNQMVSKRINVPVIMMTAFGTLEGAVQAIKSGAREYIVKPFDVDEMLINIKKTLDASRMRSEVNRIHASQRKKFAMSNIIGTGPAMKSIFTMVDKIVRSRASTILICGESGTGKDFLAKAIHYNSDKADYPFMNITCSALPEQLLESELFGFEKGAFTDAKAQKKGLVELANGGTLFLDEIGDMPLALQAKVLRFLEEKQFRRVGGVHDISVDVRVIAATNKDLVHAVEEHTFRRDLYFRLKVIPVCLPPLRERKEDIPILANHFISVFNAEFKKNVKGISSNTLQMLMDYHWPGNVREIKNIIERAMILGSGDELGPEDLHLELRECAPELEESGPTSFPLSPGGISLDEVERSFVMQALASAKGNQTKAAALLGISRDRMRYRLEKFKIQKRNHK